MRPGAEQIDDPYVIQTDSISKNFGAVRAVRKLSISIPKRGLTSIAGPNGSGKSTLVNLLSGVLPLDGGIVIVDGTSLKVVKAHENPAFGLTRTFQEVRLFDQVTVWNNIMVVLTERGLFRALLERVKPAQRDKVRGILENVGLWDKRDALALNLSYGQRKLLEIGRAMAMEADIYLFDEPFAGLFPEMVEKVKEIMNRMREQGDTIVFISHNMDIVRELSDHLIILDSGSLLAEGAVDEVLSRPKVIEAYLGA